MHILECDAIIGIKTLRTNGDFRLWLIVYVSNSEGTFSNSRLLPVAILRLTILNAVKSDEVAMLLAIDLANSCLQTVSQIRQLTTAS